MKIIHNFLIWIIIFILSVTPAISQKLEAILTELAAAMQEVSDERNNYIQSVNFEVSKPYRVTFVCRDVILKDGKEKEHRYELNLADLDKNLVRRITTSKILAVSLGVQRSVNAIKYFQDGNQQNYQNSFQIRAKDSDNMEQIEQLLRAAIPLAEELWEGSLEINMNSLSEMLGWLRKSIGKVAVGEDMFAQSLSSAEREDLVRLEVEEVSEKVRKMTTQQFSLGDLQEQRITYKIQGSKIVVEAKTKENRNMVTLEQDGEQQKYVSGIQILCNDLDEAKQIVLVLQKAVPLAAASLTSVTPQPASLEEAFALITEHVTSTNDGRRDINQTFEGSCLAILNKTIADEKEQEQYRSLFDFSDIDERNVKLEIKDRSISFNIRIVNNNNYIQVYKNGEQDKYVNSVSIELPNIETIRLIEPAIRYVIKECKSDVVAENADWLINRTNAYRGNGDMTQILAQETSNPCKYSLSVNTITQKASQEELYEFNIKDMDARQIMLSVSGKDVTVVLPTKGKQKLINYYRDGKPMYVEKVTFGVADVTEGKNFKATLETLVEGCQ